MPEIKNTLTLLQQRHDFSYAGGHVRRCHVPAMSLRCHVPAMSLCRRLLRLQRCGGFLLLEFSLPWAC
jgi:hypothetical protein